MVEHDLQAYGLVLKVSEVCNVLRLCPNSVYDLCRSGELKAIYKKKKCHVQIKNYEGGLYYGKNKKC